MTVTHRTSCPLDCPDACSLEVTVDGEGRMTRVDATRDNPLSQGFLCDKVRRIDRHVYGEHRVSWPARRTGKKGRGEFERLSWDAALGLLAERLGRLSKGGDGEAILPLSYGGSNGLLSQDTVDARLFFRLGASNLARTVCAAPSTAAAIGLYGKMPGVALEDYHHANLIVVWGANPSSTGIHLVPIIRKARARGAQLVVIDPRSTPLAKQADLHLAPRPGTDLALALAIHRYLFESGRADFGFLGKHATGHEELAKRASSYTFEHAAAVADVDRTELERFAELYAETTPAVIRCGWGVERNRNGGSAVAAILALPAVAGKFAVRGGGYTMSNGGAWRLRSAAGSFPPSTRTINMNQVGRALLEADPPVRLLFVYNNNPLMTLPNQELVRRGLEREDLFTVVFEQVMTDTALYADLVLPATTFLEHHDLRKSYGAMAIQRVDPVIAPVGEARSNVDVFGELCERLGLQEASEPRGVSALADCILEGQESAQQDLAAGRLARPPGGDRPIQFVDVFPDTAERKVRLVPKRLDEEAPLGLYALRPHPEDPAADSLVLVSPASRKRISSTFGQLDRAPAKLRMHPDDARARNLTAEDPVRVFNSLGEVRCGLEVTTDVRKGVVELEKGLWSHHTTTGTTANALAPDFLTDIGKGACFNDARVEVERAGTSQPRRARAAST